MTVKSVIDIEVNDDAFKEFAGVFEKYQAALAETPAAWASTEKLAAGTALNVESLIAGLLTHEAINKRIAKQEAEEQRRLERQYKIIRTFAPTFREVAQSVTSITASIAKWATGTGILGGLVGFGGLLGLDRMALDVGAGRRESQGIGVSYGEKKAFENSYSRLVDPQSFLGGVNEAMTDITKRWTLQGAGLTERDLAGKDTAQVSNLLLPALKKLADTTPDAQLAQMIQARGLGQFVGVQDLERLKKTTPEELRTIQGGYVGKTEQFNLEDQIARKWQDLGVVLNASKNKIENVLVRGLEPLAKPLGELSNSVANALKNFLTGIDPNTIKGIGHGIEDFGKYLGSPKFRTDVKEFADDVSYAAKKIASALKWLGLIPDNSPEKLAADERTKSLFADGKEPTLAEYAASRKDPKEIDPNRPAKWFDPGSWFSHDGGLGALSDKFAVNDKLLDSIRWQESHGNPRALGPMTKYGQAKGAYQLMDSTSKQYGANPWDPASAREGARKYLLDLMKHYGGDIQKSIAAYNWGEGHLDKDIHDNRERWRDHLPRETRKYLAEVMGQISGDLTGHARAPGVPVGSQSREPKRGGDVRVVIQNSTGGSAIVQSNQVAH